jgi:hypothetical protein
MALPRTSAVLAAAAGALALAVGGSAADAAHHHHGCGGGSGGLGPKRGCADPAYAKPIKASLWYPSRIDMGVDYVPTKRTPVRAIGDARVVVSDSNSGWPGGHYMVYKLLSGDHAGNRIFVAETLKGMAKKGKVVHAGDRIAMALTGGTGIETGFADRTNQPRAARCYSEGMKTNSGREMARFLRNLGVPLGDRPGPGPDYPSGQRCRYKRPHQRHHQRG